MSKQLKVLFVCTSNADRSPALVKYFQEKYPQYEYKSAGVNRYFTEKKKTHYLTQEDLNWADLKVFCEGIHYKIAHERFENIPMTSKTSVNYGQSIILECGEYEQGNVGEDYLIKAEDKLKAFL